jgi:hypothetical protein
VSYLRFLPYTKNEIVTVKVGDWIEGNDRLKPPTMKQLWYGLAPYRTKVNEVEVHYLSHQVAKHFTHFCCFPSPPPPQDARPKEKAGPIIQAETSTATPRASIICLVSCCIDCLCEVFCTDACLLTLVFPTHRCAQEMTQLVSCFTNSPNCIKNVP